MSEIKREILRSQKSLLDGIPDNSEGREGERTYRRVDGYINQYIKSEGEWILLSTSAPLPKQDVKGIRRTIYSIIQSDSELTVNEHHDLSGLADDDHSQYLLASGARALSGSWDMGSQIISNINIDSGAIDGTTIGTNSAVTDLRVDNLKLDSNAITSTNTNGNLELSTNGSGDISLHSLNYPSSDGTDAECIITDGSGTLFFGNPEKVYIQVRNDEGSTLSAGTPLYSRGAIGGSNRIKVGKCDANDTSKMPCIGIAIEEMNTSSTKDNYAIVSGTYNTNISGFTGLAVNDTIYISNTGTLTQSKPSGDDDLIQNVGIVLKTNGTTCQGLLVSAIGRTNDIPNKLVKNGDFTIQTDSDLILDADGDIILDADGSSISLKNGGIEALRFNLSSSPNLMAFGDFSIDGDSSVSIDSDSGVINLQDNKTNILRFTNTTGDWKLSNETTGKIIDIHVSGASMLKMSDAVYIGGYTQTLYTPYKVHSKANKNHFTTGFTDYEENYSMIADHFISTSYNTGYGS